MICLQDVRTLVLLSLLTPPPPPYVQAMKKLFHQMCPYAENNQFLENHSLFTYNGHNLHIETCLEELQYIYKCCLQAL